MRSPNLETSPSLDTESRPKVIPPGLTLSILTQFYPPDFAATGQFVEELARYLTTQAIAVRVFTGMPGYAYDKTTIAPAQEVRDGIIVRRSRVSQWGSRRMFGRALGGVLFCVRAAIHLLKAKNRGDLILFVSEPPYLQTLGYVIHRLFRLPYACLVYDLYPDVAIELKVLSETHWITRFWHAVNRRVWQRAEVIIVPSETMQERIASRVPSVASKIAVIHNWADPTWIKPIDKHSNPFAKTHQLVEPFTVLYSGNMGRCHDMETILSAAQDLASEAVQFVFIGAGPKREWFEAKVKELDLKNCKFLPYQERELLPQSLTACDLALVSVAPGMEGLVAPSKFYSALASGRPVAVICEPHSYLRHLVAEARCGAAFSNGDGKGLSGFIRYLAKHPELKTQLGEAGHHYIADYYTPEAISRQYAQVFQQAVFNDADLDRAIEQQEFHLLYQPVFSLRTGQIHGFEVRLRWHHPQRGLLGPEHWLSRLEATGSIQRLTPWVLQTAATQFQDWLQYPACEQLTLRINLARAQLFDPALVGWVEQIWLQAGFKGHQLGFDLTEASLLQDPAAAVAVLLQLRDRGVRLYLEGFGLGYASLQSLHRFPLDGLEVDRTLIRNLGTAQEERRFLESLISLADDLGLSLQAEGIETPTQLERLRSLGLQQGQGHWFAPALEARNASQLLQTNRTAIFDPDVTYSATGALAGCSTAVVAPPDFTIPGLSSIATSITDPDAEDPDAPLVLIVDDERMMRKLLRRAAQQEGYRVIEAESGEQALVLYAEHQPDLVLLDAMMAGMTGFECCAQLCQSDPARARVLLITTLDDADSVDQAFAAGAMDYVTKPVNWPVLRQRLRRLGRVTQPI